MKVSHVCPCAAMAQKHKKKQGRWGTSFRPIVLESEAEKERKKNTSNNYVRKTDVFSSIPQPEQPTKQKAMMDPPRVHPDKYYYKHKGLQQKYSTRKAPPKHSKSKNNLYIVYQVSRGFFSKAGNLIRISSRFFKHLLR